VHRKIRRVKGYTSVEVAGAQYTVGTKEAVRSKAVGEGGNGVFYAEYEKRLHTPGCKPSSNSTAAEVIPAMLRKTVRLCT
jgi:hypothetical protein